MNFLVWLLGQGAVVSLVTDALKKIPFVERHPKLVAALLNVVALLIQEGFLKTVPPGVTEFILAVITAFGASVGTYQLKKDVGKVITQ